ncbi:MAG: glycosyltransferase [Bacteroidota bacterium]
MKVFVLLSRVPYPLEKGDKLRAFHQVRELSKKHEVYLCCLTDQPVDSRAKEVLSAMVAHLRIIPLRKSLIALRMLRALLSDRPFQVHYFLQAGARREVKGAIDSFGPDQIYCQLVRCSDYVKHLYAYPKTLDYMDALNAGLRRRAEIAPWFLRPFIREEARRMVAYENLIFEYFDHHTIISEQDRQLIYHPAQHTITVVPNGADAAWFAPDAQPIKDTELVFTGNMSYPPNVNGAVLLARDILPMIAREIPDVRLRIAGANPTAAVRALQSPQVEVTGWLDDMRDAYRRSRIFIAPMRIGSGLQNKLLEAMSMELPCLTTTLAAQAMPPEARECLVIADEPADLASEAVRLLRNEDECRSRGKAGRAAILRHFDWQATTHILESLWTSPRT